MTPLHVTWTHLLEKGLGLKRGFWRNFCGGGEQSCLAAKIKQWLREIHQTTSSSKCVYCLWKT